jgi:uncharacterized protein YndB with AHSA1/START domain
MTPLPYVLDRSLVIRATPDTVFRFFTDGARWASWWGEGSTIDARPGGRVFIRYPGGVEVAGEILDIAAPERLVFTYGFVSGRPIAPGASVVTIQLEPVTAGTQLRLSHAFAEETVRDEHVQGWRYQLALFGNLVSNDVNREAQSTVDAWFATWAETDGAERARRLAAIAVPEVTFRDRYGHTNGAADLLPHIAAAQRFMPGIRLARRGDVRHCQGMVLADWVAVSADGQERGAGTNVFTLDARGRIEAVTGFATA